MITRQAGLAAALAIMTAGAAAHPHRHVDQQVSLSVGPEGAGIAIVILPSAAEGDAIHGRLDRDGDGAISDGEAAVFGGAVVQALRLEVDGSAVPLGKPDMSLAGSDAIRAGLGAIRIEAQAAFDLAPGQDHRLVFRVDFDAFSHGWFVQPFYHTALTDLFAVPDLSRSPNGSEVVLHLTPRR